MLESKTANINTERFGEVYVEFERERVVSAQTGGRDSDHPGEGGEVEDFTAYHDDVDITDKLTEEETAAIVEKLESIE